MKTFTNLYIEAFTFYDFIVALDIQEHSILVRKFDFYFYLIGCSHIHTGTLKPTLSKPRGKSLLKIANVIFAILKSHDFLVIFL